MDKQQAANLPPGVLGRHISIFCLFSLLVLNRNKYEYFWQSVISPARCGGRKMGRNEAGTGAEYMFQKQEKRVFLASKTGI